jgi:hypothetical protein
MRDPLQPSPLQPLIGTRHNIASRDIRGVWVTRVFAQNDSKGDRKSTNGHRLGSCEPRLLIAIRGLRRTGSDAEELLLKIRDNAVPLQTVQED